MWPLNNNNRNVEKCGSHFMEKSSLYPGAQDCQDQCHFTDLAAGLYQMREEMESSQSEEKQNAILALC